MTIINKIEITIKSTKFNIIALDVANLPNLLTLNNFDDEYDVDTLRELKEQFKQIQLKLFGVETIWLSEMNVIEVKGLLLKNNPFYKNETVVQFINGLIKTNQAKHTKIINISDFDVEVSLTPQKLDYSCDDTPTPENFENEQELEKFIEDTFFLNVIDGFAGTGGKSFMQMLITKYSMSKFIKFISSDDVGLDLYERIEILENALLSA